MTTWPETPLHDHPWPEPDCAECQSLATTRIPERPKEKP